MTKLAENKNSLRTTTASLWAPVERNSTARPHTPDCAPKLSHCKELVTAYLELNACLSNRMLFIHLSYIWDQTGNSVYITAMSLYQTGFKKFMMHSLHSMGSAEFWGGQKSKARDRISEPLISGLQLGTHFNLTQYMDHFSYMLLFGLKMSQKVTNCCHGSSNPTVISLNFYFILRPWKEVKLLSYKSKKTRKETVKEF